MIMVVCALKEGKDKRKVKFSGFYHTSVFE